MYFSSVCSRPLSSIRVSSSLALDHLRQPVDALGDSRAVDGVRLLNVPRSVRNLTKAQLLCDFLLALRVWQVWFVRKEEHWKLPISNIYKPNEHNEDLISDTPDHGQFRAQLKDVCLKDRLYDLPSCWSSISSSFYATPKRKSSAASTTKMMASLWE